MVEVSTFGAPERRQLAERAMDSLTDPGERVLLRVNCGRSHHVATIFGTDAGPVFCSTLGQHAHGSRDFVDTAHGAHRHGTAYTDLLMTTENADDGLPASCECGPVTVSRAMIRQAIDQGQHTLHLP